MSRTRRTILISSVASLGLLGVGVTAASGAPSTVSLSTLHGSTTPTAFTLADDVAGATSSKLILDGQYVGQDTSVPFTFDLAVTSGSHTVKVRSVVNGVEVRTDATFTATGTGGTVPSTTTTTKPTDTTGPSTTTTTRPTTTTTRPTTTTTTPPVLPPPPAGIETVVDTVEEIRAAFATARPGAIIRIADGEYQFKPRLVASASGTPSTPIIVRGSRRAVLRTKNASGDYGLHITGDHWRVEGITVAHGSKGIVLDGSVGTVLDGIEVFDVGAEAVHFRTCSSDGVLRNSFIHDTGINSAQYGEGVYVGSANSNWASYQCTDAVERQTQGDNTERVLVENNVFEDITAEGADLKEGTDSGTLRNNVFRRAGNSGQNSADSAVDAKGNNWIIEGNTVSEGNAPWNDHGVMTPSEFLDGFQSHSVYSGYGTRNVFRRNQVIGAIPGFGIGMYPKLANVVTCDNSAPGAAKSLVGDNSKPSTCS